MLKEPDHFFGDFWAKIKPSWKFAFKASLIIFLITHLFMLTNTFQNNDTSKNLYGIEFTVTSGRWFLSFASAPSSFISMPWINGLLSFAYMALTVIIIVELFGATNRLYITLAAAALITFPTVATSFSYMFMADPYFMAVLLAALAVLLTQRYKKGFIAGGVLLALSLGIYQAYISFSIMLIVIFMLFELLNENTSKKQFFSQLLRFLVMGAISLVLYYVVLQIALSVTGLTLSTYQGLDNIQGFSMSFERLLTTLSNLITGTAAVFTTLIPETAFGVFVAFLMLLYFAALIVYYIKVFRSGKLKDKAWRIVMLIVLAIALPIGQQIIVVVNPLVDNRLLVQLSACCYFMILPLLLDKYPLSQKSGMIIKYAGSAVCFLFCWHLCLSSNIAYINAQQQYEKEYGLCLRLVDRLEQHEEFDIDTPVMFVGTLPSNTYPDDNPSDKYIGGYGDMTGNSFFLRSRDFTAFINNYLNVPLLPVPNGDVELMKTNSEFLAMDEFPAENCIKVIDGVIVVKISHPGPETEQRPVFLVRLWQNLTGGLWLD